MIAFDPDCIPTDKQIFEGITIKLEYWNEFYPDASEAHMRKKLEPLGEPVTVRVYEDSNHAGNLANRRYHSGVLIYVNNVLINFYRKIHNTFESSSFGSYFVALRMATGMVEALSNKLRTFGVNLEVQSEFYCDNKSVVTNSSILASVLNKRHNAICYHIS